MIPLCLLFTAIPYPCGTIFLKQMPHDEREDFTDIRFPELSASQSQHTTSTAKSFFVSYLEAITGQAEARVSKNYRKARIYQSVSKWT